MVKVRHTLQEMQKPIIDGAIFQALACPVCRAPLQQHDANTILCSGCGRRYPICDGLPVLRPDVTE